MSPDLARALHDAVDTGPDDAPFAVDGLTSRIRRRRTVRAGVRGGVAVGAAGAVAFGATVVGRTPQSVLPAARGDAAPGTCGSDIGSLAPATDSPVGFLELGGRTDSIDPQRAGALGTFIGRHLRLGVAAPAEPEPLDLRALVTRGTTVVATGTTDPDATWTMIQGTTAVRDLPLDLVTCAGPDETGGVPLPAGDYSVYVTYREPAQQDHAVVGPAALSLTDPTPVVGLPADFPAGLELLGDRLVSARQDTPDGRWVVETVEDADDRVTTAAAMLELGVEQSSVLGVGQPDPQGALVGQVDGWMIRVAPSTTAQNESSIVYTLTPKP